MTSQDGDFSSGSTYLGGQAPTIGSVVIVKNNVAMGANENVGTICVESGGRLWAPTNRDTTLRVTTLQVKEGGTLEIGTEANPIGSNSRVEIIFNDEPIDLNNDPGQYGHGLIAKGKVTVHGAPMSDTWVDLSAAPSAGSAALNLSKSVSGWKSGSLVMLPDTIYGNGSRQKADGYIDKSEIVTLGSISGTQAMLSTPLTYSHPGSDPVNGVTEYYPQVANLSRNVIFRTANQTGVRAHTIYMHRAEVDIRYAEFKNLGRTTIRPIHSTTFDSTGNPMQVGTNMHGRYPVHFHHCWGRANAQSGIAQYTFIGNSIYNETHANPVTETAKWGIGIHDSHYGLIKDNVFYRNGGTGLMTEDGSESFNVIDHNLAIATAYPGDFLERADNRANSGPQLGFEGVGFWFRGTNNYVRNNVASALYGYMYYLQVVGFVRVPRFPGADMTKDSETQLVDMAFNPFLQFENNLAHNSHNGLEIWQYNYRGGIDFTVGNYAEGIIKNFTTWNCYRGYFSYVTNYLTFQHPVMRGYRGGGSGFYPIDYAASNTLVVNADLQNLGLGYGSTAHSGGGKQEVRDSYIRCYIGVYMGGAWTAGAGNTLWPRKLIVKNVKFDSLNIADIDGAGPQRFLAKDLKVMSTQQALSLPDEFIVYDFNQQRDNNFKVFSHQQKPNVVLPQSTVNPSDGAIMLFGSPVAGKTNAQNWNDYALTKTNNGWQGVPRTSPSQPGIAWGGEVAPCSSDACPEAIQNDKIDGLAFSLNLPPTISIANPAPGSLIKGPNVVVNYLKFGNMSEADHVHLKLDDGSEQHDLDFDGTFTLSSVSDGDHVIAAYLSRADHSKIDGTDTQVSFKVGDQGVVTPPATNPPDPNNPPVVSAGINQVISLTEEAQLFGTVTDDGKPTPPGLIATWSKVSGPGTVSFRNASALQTSSRFSKAGEYTLRLSVSDGAAISSDETQVTVHLPSGENNATYDFRDQVSRQGAPISFGYTLTENGHVFLGIYDRFGHLIKEIINENQLAGVYTREWDLKNRKGETVSSGIYMGRLKAPGIKEDVKIGVVR